MFQRDNQKKNLYLLDIVHENPFSALCSPYISLASLCLDDTHALGFRFSDMQQCWQPPNASLMRIN